MAAKVGGSEQYLLVLWIRSRQKGIAGHPTTKWAGGQKKKSRDHGIR